MGIYEKTEPRPNELHETLMHLVGCLIAQRKYRAAEPFAVRDVAFATTLGETWRFQALQLLADLRNLLGQYAEAEQLAWSVLDKWAEADGHETAFTAPARRTLARALAGQKRFTDAEAQYQRVIAFEQALQRPAQVAALLDELVPIYRATGREADAAAAAKQAAEFRAPPAISDGGG